MCNFRRLKLPIRIEPESIWKKKKTTTTPVPVKSKKSIVLNCENRTNRLKTLYAVECSSLKLYSGTWTVQDVNVERFEFRRKTIIHDFLFVYDSVLWTISIRPAHPVYGCTGFLLYTYSIPVVFSMYVDAYLCIMRFPSFYAILLLLSPISVRRIEHEHTMSYIHAAQNIIYAHARPCE